MKKQLPKQAVILAAGESSRFWPLNEKHKSLIRVMGKPMIWYTLRNLSKSGVQEVIIIQSPKKFVEKELANFPVKGLKINYAVQEKPKGTGDGLLKAKELIKNRFVVLNAERIDMYKYAKELAVGKGDIVLMASKTDKPWLYGILNIKEGKVVEMVEKPKKGNEPSDLMNCGAYIFNKEFMDVLAKEKDHPFSLIYAINKFAKKGNISYIVVDGSKMFTLKFPWDVFKVREFLFDSELNKKIEPSAKVPKSVKITGKVYIGKNVVIGENTVIQGPCYIGDDCEIGINNIIRGPVDIEAFTYTGGMMEIKDSIIGQESHFHSGYLGNSVIGENCKLGAGFVSANRRIDRRNVRTKVKGELVDINSAYFGTVCGPRTKFGAQCLTMPGTMVGRDCIVGPQMMLKDNLEDNKIFFKDSQTVKKQKKF